MKAVNEATMMVLDQFKKKVEQVPFEEHPYSNSRKALRQIGRNEWDDEHRDAATRALALWVKTIVISSVAVVHKEIVTLMDIAANNGHKREADDLASSMNFVEAIFTMHIDAVDVLHIAEWLFEDGLRREQEIAAKKAAESTTSEPPKPQVGKIHKRWEPSQN